MKNTYLAVAAGVILLGFGVWLRPSVPRAFANEGPGGVEYGVFRIHNFYDYEWQDSDERVYGQSQKIFLEKMRLHSIAFKMGNLRDAPLGSLDYVLEGEMLNYFGREGWELVEYVDKGFENRTFWFRRDR